MIRLLPPPKSDEDLFRESTMTFGEHLEELRRCLFRALLGLAVGVVIGLMFGNWVVLLVQHPLEKALTKHYVRQSQLEVKRQLERLQSSGASLAFTPETASQFVMTKQVLAEEYLLSPREVLVQLGSSLEAIRKRWEDDGAAVRFLIQFLESGSPVPENLEDLQKIERGFNVLQSRWATVQSAASRGMRAASASDVGGISSKDVVQWKGIVLGKESLDPQARAQLIWALKAVHGEIQKGAAAIRDGAGALAGLFHAASQDPGQLEDSELMHVFLWRPAKEDPRVRAKSLSAHEAFAIYMKASFLLGAIISSPWVFYQIWSFVAAGLYRHERRFVYIFLPFSLGLFLAGAALAFLYVFEPVLTFLFQFNEWLGIQLEPRISEWLSFVLILPLGFGVGFQLPLVMLFLERIGIFSVQDYWSQWRLAVVVIFVVAAILTPPDPSSQLLMAVPLLVLYFGGIALCKLFPRQLSKSSRPVSSF